MIRAVVAALAALGAQEKSASPAPSAFVEPQDPDRPSLSSAELKSLLGTNIFSPRKVTRKPVAGVRGPEPVKEKPKPKPPVVTGIILDPATQTYQVVVEDRNSERLKLLSEPKFLKAGDQVLVYTIDSIESEKVVVSWAGAHKELRVGESLPADASIKAPEGADLSGDEEIDAPAEAKADPAPSTPATEPKSGSSKADRRSDTKRATEDSKNPSSTMDEETRKKILEERMKRLGKKRPE